LKEMHAHCETWARRYEIVFASIKYDFIHLTRNSRKFDMQTIVRICDVVKQSFNQIRVLKVQIDIKFKWRCHVKNIQKKWSLKRWRCHVSSFSSERRVLSKHVWFTKWLSDLLLFTHRFSDMRRMIAQITSSIRRRNLSRCSNIV
jgi:hypothetical protein